MAHITNATIQNYKSIREAFIDFSMGLNVIIGQNGSGKTNFVNAIGDLVKYKLEEEDVFLYLEIFDGAYLWNIKSQPKLADNKKIGERESKYNYDRDSNQNIDKSIFENEDHYNGYIDAVIDNFEELLYDVIFIKYGIPFEKIEPLKIIGNGIFRIEPNYTIFHKILQQIWKEKYNKTDDFIKNVLIFPNELIRILNTYSPIQNIKFLQERVQVYEEYGKIHYDNIQIQFQVSGKWLYWQQLSDGTKRLFYILTELYLAQGIVFIEEPELGIHPHQLHDLMLFITEQAKTKQIIVTTHSPQVLNHLTSEELHKIIICEMTENGTKMRHLTAKQTQKAQSYMKTQLSLGDYWVHADLEPSNDDEI